MIFFSRTYLFTTQLTLEEIYQRVAEVIEPLDYFRLEFITTNVKDYEGEINGGSFKIRKIGNYRSSYLAMASTVVTVFAGETQIEIKIKPSSVALFFHLLWYGFFVSIGLICLCINIVKPFNLMALLMFLFVCVIFFLGYNDISFKSECEALREFLFTLLEGY